MSEERISIPALGAKFPSFEALTTHGKIKFPDDYKGKWVILFIVLLFINVFLVILM